MNHFITTHAGTAACILMTVCMLLTARTFLISAGIFAVGAIAALINQWIAIAGFVVWLIYFLKDQHMDAHKAFEKYKIL